MVDTEEPQTEARHAIAIQRLDSGIESGTDQTGECEEDASPRIYATEEERMEAYLEF